jgi:hypothetical protein
MDILDFMRKINAIGKYFIVAVLILNLMPLVTAGATGNIKSALYSLCVLSQTFLGAASMVLIVLAGTIYAIGQVLGAETRARASVWATAMLTGAVIGILIYLITPMVLNALVAGTGVAVAETNPCSGIQTAASNGGSSS